MSGRKGSVNPEDLSQLNLNAAGIDVGATSHYVAVPADRAEQPVREFEAFTTDLYRLADWLAECGVETVVMESTGVYWIPLFGVLEERGFQVMLVDPRRIKNVPGRKTDVLDCQWLQQLHTSPLTNVVTQRLVSQVVRRRRNPEHRTLAPVGSLAVSPGAWLRAMPAADAVVRSIRRQHPRTPGHSAAWCR